MQMHPAMHRYAGNPMMRFHGGEDDDGYGPEQPHQYPGDHAQHPPIFAVPQAVRGRRPVPSRAIRVGQENGVPVAFLRDDLDGFNDVFERLAHGFPKKRPRAEPCGHNACRLKQHVPEFGLPYTALSPSADDEQTWLQAQRAQEETRAAALEEELEKDRAESVVSGAESFREAWADASARVAAQQAQAAAASEAAAAFSFAQYFLKQLQSNIAAGDDEKSEMIEGLIDEFCASVVARRAEGVQEAIEQQKQAAYETVLEWAKAARDVEETKHDQRVAAQHAAAEAAARRFADEWKTRRRNQEAARRAQLQESWKKKQEQQISALRALRERQAAEKIARRQQLEEAAEQLLAEQRKELAAAQETDALQKQQQEAANRLAEAHEKELEQQRAEHDRHAAEALAQEEARQAAETARVAALWRAGQAEREAEIQAVNDHFNDIRATSPSSCACELPHPHEHASSSDTTPATTPPAGTPEAKPATDPVEAGREPDPAPTEKGEQADAGQAEVRESLAKIARIRKAANAAVAAWRDGAFVPIHESKDNETEVKHARQVFEEALLQEVLHLDLVESYGNLEVRQARKQAIKDIEDCVSTLKEYGSFYDYKPNFQAKAVMLASA